MIVHSEVAREPLPTCNECNEPVDPNDAAPSCGQDVLCVPCFTTADFRCSECRRVWAWLEADMDDWAYQIARDVP